MHDIYILFTAVGILIIIIGLFSNFINTRFVPAPLIAMLLGIFLGPHVTGIIDSNHWQHNDFLLEQAARITIAIGLMAVALRLPPGYVRNNAKKLIILLGIVMPIMWLSSSIFVYLTLSLPIYVSLLIGAIIAPTDPIVSSSIVTGDLAEKNLPANVRQLISAESGLNDGLGYPFVVLPLLLMSLSTSRSIAHFFTDTLLWEVIAATFSGGIIGYLAGKALVIRDKRKAIAKSYIFTYTVAVSLFVLGFAKLLQTDGILAVFISGLVLSTVVSNQIRLEEENFQETVNHFFSLPIFILFGLLLPVKEWLKLGWPAIALIALVILLRRIPAILILRSLIPEIKSLKNALFIGWFGPIGIAALFYSNFSYGKTDLSIIWHVSSLLIFSSIIIHGLTSVWFTRLYGKIGKAT